jgi:hypothetical protein
VDFKASTEILDHKIYLDFKKHVSEGALLDVIQQNGREVWVCDKQEAPV